ncbi:MAG TPA: hypothetical protein VFZ48_04480 [Candidatus Saccharimonadales bacterium]
MAAITLHTDTYSLPSVKVIAHKKSHRVAVLCDQGEPKSLAVTIFPVRKSAILAMPDRDIRLGGLMGKTFRAHGFAVDQNRLLLVRRPLPHYICKRLDVPQGSKGYVEVYEFFAGPHCYGIVIEYVKDTAVLPPRPARGSRFVRCIPGQWLRLAITEALAYAYLKRSLYYALHYSGTLDA